mmetsp:Transcript_34935/g.88785  ORF Transcript_34935/g.88785 Transcript_34935/m.88785 type:complete len:442 (-) Transcript_34935:448-1773(-)
MRHHDTPALLNGHHRCRNGFRHRADLVNLEQECVAGSLLNGSGNPGRVGHKQVIAHDLHLRATLSHEGRISFPIILVERVLNGDEGVLGDPLLVVFDHFCCRLLHRIGAALRMLEVKVILFRLSDVELRGCDVRADFDLGSMARLFDCLHQHVKRLVVILHRGSETTLIANIAGILAVLFLDHALQRVVHFGTNLHGFLEGRCADRQDHELLASQAVAGMAAPIDNVEGWDGHHELVRGATGDVGDVLVEWHLHRSSPGTAYGHRHRQDGIGTERGLRPTPIVLRTIDNLDHRLVDALLVRHLHADKLRCNDVVDVLHCLEHTLAQQPALVTITELQGLVNTCGRTAGHSCTEQVDIRLQVDLNRGIAAGVEDFPCLDANNLGGRGNNSVYLGHVASEVHEAVGVAPLVVVPRDKLHKLVRKCNARLLIEDRREGTRHKVR